MFNLIKFELKADHLQLLKGIEDKPHNVNRIIYKKLIRIDSGIMRSTKRQRKEIVRLCAELNTALEVIKTTGGTELGFYMSKEHSKRWVKM